MSDPSTRAQPARITKDFAFDVHNVTEGSIEGYASVFNNIDSAGDIIAPGAFKRTLASWQAKGRPIPVLWQHDAYDPIGVTEAIAEDTKGLHVKARLITTVQRARDAHALAEAGALGGLSIGFSVPKTASDGEPAITRDDKSGAQVFREVRLWEYSLVTFPANEEATITSVKHHEWADDLTSVLAEVRDALREHHDQRVLDAITDLKTALGITRARPARRENEQDTDLARVLREATTILDAFQEGTHA